MVPSCPDPKEKVRGGWQVCLGISRALTKCYVIKLLAAPESVMPENEARYELKCMGTLKDEVDALLRVIHSQ